MNSSVTYSCVDITKKILTSRLYVCQADSVETIKSIIFVQGKERCGLGMTKYDTILGRFLTLIGFAFRTKGLDGKDIYINKKSFCNLIDRLRQNMAAGKFNPDFIEQEYRAKKTKETILRVNKVRITFNSLLSSFSNKNIGEISTELLKKV